MRNFHYERIASLIRGTENGPCVNLRCGSLRFKPRATFFHKPTESWICLECAQRMNAQAMRNKTPKEAISGQEYMMEILRAYAYAAHERGERRRYWDNAKINKKTGDYESPYKLPHELAYWRKHRDLQAWMSDLWNSKGQPYPNTDADPIWGSTFNGVELELEWDDIQKLEEDIKNCRQGLFRDSYSREDDLQFCLDAKEQIFLFRKRIFYYSSW